MNATKRLESYLCGQWSPGEGIETQLVNPVDGTVLATASTRGLDLNAALEFARNHGGASLRALSFAQRAKLLGTIADTLTANRARYESIAIDNSGNTRADAAIDIDGGIGTLKYYARLGSSLAEAAFLLDDKPARLSKAENYQSVHLLAPRRGAAVHINAFNFPSWGLWEKVAVALLAGVPVLAKPATATAALSYEMVRDVVSANILPVGSLNLLCGSAGDLLNHVTGEDVIAFTGSSATANSVRAHPNVLAQGTLVNIEADSINAALLGPDVSAGTTSFNAFIKEVVREMTVKAGQKCTAIRRIFVPSNTMEEATQAIAARLAKVIVGDPHRDDVRMGPLVTKPQQAAALAGIERLNSEASFVCGTAGPPKLEGIDPERSSFIAPTLLKIDDPTQARSVHDTEVFGPVATIIPYADGPTAFALIGRGGGSLVTSVYSADPAFLARCVAELGSTNGRLLMVDPDIADVHTGHGIVMPQCHHGGPGRAGNGEELGGLNGLRLYHQRFAVQGSSALLGRLISAAAPMH